MKRKAILIAGILAAATALAQPQAPQLGRLFATPAERAGLDALRASGGAPPPPPAAVPLEAGPPPEPVMLNGIVRRGDGKSTVWINQQPQPAASDGLSAPGRAPSLTLQLGSGKRVTLKPGQRYDGQGNFKDVDVP